MAALASTLSTPTPLQCIHLESPTTEQHDHRLRDLSLSLSGNIALSGNHSSGRTFIDLYFGNSDSRDKPELFYSKDFEKYSNCYDRYVSFLEENGSKVVTCIGDKLEILDTNNESKVLRSCRVNGEIHCLAVREGEIFIGLEDSQTVIVFNNDLKETKKIKLKGIKDGDCPFDLQVIKDKVFVRTGRYGEAYAISESDGSAITQYRDTTGKYINAWSITVSERLGLVAVLWEGFRIIVYSLNENKSFLVFDVDPDNVYRIRISDKDRTIITGNRWTCEIKMYDLEQLFSFDAMKRTLAYIASPDELQELRKYFGVTEEEMGMNEAGDEEDSDKISEKEKTVKRMEYLLTIIGERGHLDAYNINHLKDAVAAISHGKCVSRLQGPMEGYVLHGSDCSEMMSRQKAWENEKHQLNATLRTAEMKTNEYEKAVEAKEDELQKMKNKHEEQEQTLTQQLEQTKQSLDSSREKIGILTGELDQTKTESAKTVERLTEKLAGSIEKKEILALELNQTNKSLDESRKELETLRNQIEQSRTESTKQIDTLSSQLEQTRTDSAKEIEKLTNELQQSREECTQKTQTLKKELNESKKLLDVSKAQSSEKINALRKELERTKTESTQAMKTLTDKLSESTKEVDVTRTELKRYQLDFAKESKALKEVLDQTKPDMTELQKKQAVGKPLDDAEKTRDGDTTYLAAEFGRLTVAIAEHLTLDHCLKLAILFKVPASECDMVRRLSLVETPGVKFLDVLKKRQIINIFDVSNLQKGLAMLHLEIVNHDLVGPYQERVDGKQYELYKVEEMFSWEGVNDYLKNDADRHQIKESQTSPHEDSEPGEASQLGAERSWSERRIEDSPSQLADKHHHKLYTECIVGIEGGTIELTNVSLSIPPGALHESHVIALSVMNESPFPLDREVDTARMTPLIKLEPLGLTFKKALQLNIPHSALIPEPESHDVIIYSGQTSKNNEDSSDSVTWTQERSIPRQLKEKSVTVDIQCLSYLSASLVSQTTAPLLYIVRAVPFVDGVRNIDDDIILTVCFCSDNDSEYNMLLADYKTKLPLEQYSTLQLHRHSESDKGDAGFLSLTITSVNNTYIPDTEQGVKRFAVSHLCTASRVSHQLRLKKNQDTDRDVVDIELKFSQAQYEPTKISLEARIKDLIISEEGEKILTGSCTPGSKVYEETLIKISSSLDTEQCRELAAHFNLTREDTEMITSNQEPGKMLVKILQERELLDSQKMFLLFEGLKTCHLDEMAETVSEYISEISKQKQEEKALMEDTDIEKPEEHASFSKHLSKKRQETSHSSVDDQEVQITSSSSCVSSLDHVKALTNEGYAAQDVVKALDISKNRLVLARRVLNCLREQLDILSKKAMCLYKEQYIDENGGDINLREANVHMVIPADAVSEGTIVSVTVMTSKLTAVPSEGRAPQLTPVIKCGQEGISLNKPVTIRIPHCAAETEGITSTDMYMGFSTNGAKTHWRKRNQHEPRPGLAEDHFEVFLTQFCTISLNTAVDYKKPLAKRLRVLPLIRRVTNSTDDLTVTVWIYNDDETEHMHLLHEEINIGDNMQLDNYKQFTLKGSDKEKEIDIRSGSNRITLHKDTNVQKILSTTLWNKGRHSVAFHFQNKDDIDDVSFRLRIYTRQLLRLNVDVQCDFKVTLSELLQKPQESTRTLLKTQQPQPAMEKSFQELISRLSGQLSVNLCLEISEMFRLTDDCRHKFKKSNEPGNVLFDELIHEQLISAACVSPLDVALTRTGNAHLAEDVREYRRRNTAFPTTILSSL